jgi:uncharacterized cupin superfamily protein
MTEWTAVPEADVQHTENGCVPVSDGWFVMNVADARSEFEGDVQYHAGFESRDCRFSDYGINVQWIHPGHANGKYHREDVQESILVLRGEALLIVEDDERPLKTWDFVHLPAGTAHILAAAGDDPCAVLFVGARRPGQAIHYPVSEVAARYGASVTSPTDDPAVAYADEAEPGVAQMPWPEPAPRASAT